ncbi:hypothetical protein [Mucilaginibacter ginsenosidivorax]|uniref:Uncharacterized protein n=1 Tax=Mucilaginibacter ginsenosidivorax TaxID=862126 RepID=A0A5B8VYU5_9SPHI|nr:hypothetical protein [Mucilaginibacter ginsenosidivorax]QEC76800.1 hypothetical protein FSB76_12900 [Mucilaginibacter ginsenosidivorax]
MKPTLLLPHYFKIIGVVMAIPGFILGTLFQFGHYVIPFLSYGPVRRSGFFLATGHDNFTDEVATTLLIGGLLFIGFSKFKDESAQIYKLRLNALYWAVLVHLFLMMTLIIIFLSGIFRWHNSVVSDIVINYNLLFLLIIFIARLYYLRTKGVMGQPFYLPYLPFNIVGKWLTLIFLIGAITLIALSRWNIKVPEITRYLIFPFTLIWIASKGKNEDNIKESIRLKAMLISVYIVYGLLIVLTWVLYSVDYWVALLLGLVALQLVFIVTFELMRFKAPRSIQHLHI